MIGNVGAGVPMNPSLSVRHRPPIMSLNGPPPAPTNPVRPTRTMPAGHVTVDAVPPRPPTAAVVVVPGANVRTAPAIVTAWQTSCTLSTFVPVRTFRPTPTEPAGQSIVYG